MPSLYDKKTLARPLKTEHSVTLSSPILLSFDSPNATYDPGEALGAQSSNSYRCPPLTAYVTRASQLPWMTQELSNRPKQPLLFPQPSYTKGKRASKSGGGCTINRLIEVINYKRSMNVPRYSGAWFSCRSCTEWADKIHTDCNCKGLGEKKRLVSSVNDPVNTR